jgi:hypothetical protein
MYVDDATNRRLQAFAWRWQFARSSRKRSKQHESGHGNNRKTAEQAKHASQALG